MSKSASVQIQSEISGYISNLFRTHFGKGPTAVYVTIEDSFITIHFRGFLAAMEKNQVNQNEMQRVLITRDLIISDLEPEITRTIETVTGNHIKEFYTDWDFEKETGLMVGIIDGELNGLHLKLPSTVDERAIRGYINRASEKAQKIPEQVNVYWLNDRTILVRRSGILLEIEKEMIKDGLTDELKLNRRQLERRAFKEIQPENALESRIEETFLYWNFEKDLGYVVFRLAQEKQ